MKPMPTGFDLIRTLIGLVRQGTDFDEATGLADAQEAVGSAAQRVGDVYDVANSILPNIVRDVDEPGKLLAMLGGELNPLNFSRPLAPENRDQLEHFDPDLEFSDMTDNTLLGFIGDTAFDPAELATGGAAGILGALALARGGRRVARAARGADSGGAIGLVPDQQPSRFVGGASDDEANEIFHHIANEGEEFLGEVQGGELTEARMEVIANSMLREYDRIGQEIANGLDAKGIEEASLRLDEIASAINDVLPAVRAGDRVMVSDLLSALHGTSLSDDEIRDAMTMFFGRGVSDSMDDLRLRQADSGERIIRESELNALRADTPDDAPITPERRLSFVIGMDRFIRDDAELHELIEPVMATTRIKGATIGDVRRAIDNVEDPNLRELLAIKFEELFSSDLPERFRDAIDNSSPSPRSPGGVIDDLDDDIIDADFTPVDGGQVFDVPENTGHPLFGPEQEALEDAWLELEPISRGTLNKMARILTEMDNEEVWNGLDILDAIMNPSELGIEGLDSLLREAEPDWTPAQYNEFLNHIEAKVEPFRPGISEAVILDELRNSPTSTDGFSGVRDEWDPRFLTHQFTQAGWKAMSDQEKVRWLQGGDDEYLGIILDTLRDMGENPFDLDLPDSLRQRIERLGGGE